MSQVLPKLDAPGAGLPWLEHKLANWIFFRQLRRSTPDQVNTVIREEQAAIHRLLEGLPEASLGRQVLISRLRGLEDSSRYWSILMTLDHLCMVHLGVEKLIHSLSQGRLPGRVIGTAELKPSPEAGVERIGQFDRSCDALVESAKKLEAAPTDFKHPHPWFGPLPARAWHFLGGFHLRLHRRQIEAIRKAAGF